MKKHLVFRVFLCLCAGLVFSACSKPQTDEEIFAAWGLELSSVEAVSGYLDVVCATSGGEPLDGRISYQFQPISLEENVEGKWLPLTPLVHTESSLADRIPVQSVPPSPSYTLRANWGRSYGFLPAGHYRVGWQFWNEADTAHPDGITIYTEFTLDTPTSEEVLAAWGASVVVSEVTPTQLSFTVKADGRALQTGNYFSIQQWDGSHWLPANRAGGGEDIAYPINAGTERTFTRNWEPLYGSLAPGTYRIALELSPAEKTGDENEFTIVVCIPFSIQETTPEP